MDERFYLVISFKLENTCGVTWWEQHQDENAKYFINPLFYFFFHNNRLKLLLLFFEFENDFI